jgi:hypothetical protein
MILTLITLTLCVAHAAIFEYQHQAILSRPVFDGGHLISIILTLAFGIQNKMSTFGYPKQVMFPYDLCFFLGGGGGGGFNKKKIGFFL